MADLSNLSPAEYEKISNVLKRDRELRSTEEARIRQLKQELICLRKRAALKPGLDPLRNCARCLTELGRILNRGSLCPICLKKVCKDCRHYGDKNHEWLCIYCYKQMQLKAISGEWMLEFSRLSTQNRAKDAAGDQMRKVLHDNKRKGMLSNTIPEPTFSQLPVDPPPEKPPRIFTYELPAQNTPADAQTENVDSKKNGDCANHYREKSTPEQSRKNRLPSPKVLPRISPWSDIDPEPALPVRIDKSRPLGGGISQFEPVSFKERQSSDEGHSTAGYRSRSISSEVMDDSESHVPVPLPRKRINPLKKQQAIPDQNTVDNQQSSIETTDSGVYSPIMKTDLSLDTNPPVSPFAVSRLSSNEQESVDSPSFAHCLASESSLSETDDDRRHFYRKRKTLHSRSAEDKHSATSADSQLIIPPSGLTHSFSPYNICSNPLLNTNFKQKLIGSYFDVSKNNSSDFSIDACCKHINNKDNLTHSNFRLSSKACALQCNHKAPDTGGKAAGKSKEKASGNFKRPQPCETRVKALLTEQDGVKTKRKDRKKNFLQFPHLRKKRSKKKEYAIRNTQQQTENLTSRCSESKLCSNVKVPSKENLHLLNTPNAQTQILVENMFSNEIAKSQRTLVRSASLPSNKTYFEDWLKPWFWKCHSLEDWLWCLEEQPCQSRNFKEIVNMLPDDYKLVYVSSNSSSSDLECDSDCRVTDYHIYQSRNNSKKHLKVNSHIKINYGTSYIEDSDWEIESENSEETFMYCDTETESKINEANNFLISYVPRVSKSYEVSECFSSACDNLDLNTSSAENGSCLSNNIPLTHSSNSPVTDIQFLSWESSCYSHNSAWSSESHCSMNMQDCISLPDCREIKIDKILEKLCMPVFKENISSWPRFSSGRPISHLLSTLSSSFMNIDEEKPDFNFTRPEHFETYSQLQLISDAHLLNSSHLFKDIFRRSFTRESYFEREFHEHRGLKLDKLYHTVLILDSFSKKIHNSSNHLKCIIQFCNSANRSSSSGYLTNRHVSLSDERNSALVISHNDAVHLLGYAFNIFLNYFKVLSRKDDSVTITFVGQENVGNSLELITSNNFSHALLGLLNINFNANALSEFFSIFRIFRKMRAPRDLFDCVSWWRDCCQRKVGNWLQLDDANAFHYTAFPLSSYATNRGNDNSATGWGKLRCCIAAATERVIDLNSKALVCGREVVLDFADLTPYLGWETGTEDKLGENSVDAFLYRNPPVFKKPEVDYLLGLTRSEPSESFLQRFLHVVRAETRMIAAKFEVTGVSSLDKTNHDNTLSPNEREPNCEDMQSENTSENTQTFARNEELEVTQYAINPPWISGGEALEYHRHPRQSDSGCFVNVNKQRSAFLRWNVLESVDCSDEYSFLKQTASDLNSVSSASDVKYDFYDRENNTETCDKGDSCEFLDTEILPCIKNIFNVEFDNKYLNCDHVLVCVPAALSDNVDNCNERVDCQCNKPCEVPSSPSVVDATVERNMADDGEIFSSGDELDKFESDTDSQDTVIEGEAYKRIRSVAIKEKILHANEELFGSSNKEAYFNSHTSNVFTDNEISERNVAVNQKVKISSLEEIKSKISTQSFLPTQYPGDTPELPLFSDSEESDSMTIFSSLEKHFQSFQNQNLSAFLPVSSSFDKKKSDESGELCNRSEIHSLSSYCTSFNENTCSSESSDNGSDGEEVILSDTSTSSDEATYIAPTSSFQYYSHPMSYRLHTIAEESCEESERSSRNSIPLSKSCSDFEYFDKTRLSLVKNPRKTHHKSFTDNSSVSPSPELKNGKGSDVYAILATSRLEKYFKSSLQDGEKVTYPDEDMTDESGEVSSDEDIAPDRTKSQSAAGKKRENHYKSPKNLSSNDRCFATIKCHKLGSSSLRNLNSDFKTFQISESCKELDLNRSSLVPKPESYVAESKQNKVSEQVSDDEAKYIMNHLMQHITNNSEVNNEPNSELKDMSPMIKILESEIARLMLTVSPASLSAGEPSSSCSSTIGSNNSDYGSDTLESAEDSTSEEEINPENRPTIEVPAPVDSISSQHESASSSNAQSADFVPPSDPVVSEETLYICKQLMASLKKIADSTEGACTSDDVCTGAEDTSAKQYITDQIVSLMQTVNASQNSSPFLRRLSSNPSAIQIDSDVSQDRSDSDSPPPNDEKREHSKSKTPSESGSETTISASISIPSYDDSDRTPTESEISHEMDELYALLESGSTSQDVMNTAKFSYDLDSNHSLDKNVLSRNTDSPVSEDEINFAFSESCDFNPNSSESLCSSLYGAASKLESLLPISIEERIARYKDAFLNRAVDSKEQELRATETRINVILPQPSISESVCYDMPIPLNFDSVLNSKSEEKLPVLKSCDNILSSCSVHKGEENNYNITSVKIISHNTYPPSSAIHKILSNNIDSTYLDQKHDYNVVNICDESSNQASTSDELLKDNVITDDSDAHECTEESEPSILSPLPKVINPKEKASSENDLLVANYRTKSKNSKVFGTKSVGNICELENISNKNTFRDTGYYSFKSSEESFLSLDDSTASQTSTASLTQYRSLTSTETIPEEEESCAKGAATTKMSLSSSNIPDAVCDNSPSKSSTLPLSLRSKLSSTSNVNHRTRSSFFSTSGVLRKLTLLRDESGNSLRSSPHGRLRMRNRSLSGGSEDGRQRKTSVPQISVSECLENQSGRLSTASSEKDSSGVQDEDDQHFTYPSRSQMSLSSFGGRSESVTSVYSAAGGGRYGTVIVTGDVLFGLNYNYKVGVLEVNIKECRNLAAVDTKKNRSDPYVKVYLLPDRTKSGKRKTKVKKHTLNPVFDEVLKFKVTVSELEIRTLWLSVWHSERFGLNDFLGEVMLPLGNDTFENSGLKWHPLQERLETLDPPVSYKGDLILALKYVPPDVTSRKFSKKPGAPVKGALEVLVREARNLMATRSNGTSDPFCKSYLLPDKSKAGKQKTPVFKKSCNPKWNHTFVYDDVSLDDLRERCLELTIWDYDKITSNDFLGGVRLCLGTGKYQGRDVDWMDSIGEERSLWYTMLERPNTWVDGSLLLRSNMQSRRTV